MVAGDFILVSHPSKRVFLIQVSERLPKDHAFKSEQLDRIEDSLCLLDDYSLVLIYVLPARKTGVWPKGGMVLKHEDGSVTGVERGYIVQACITPDDAAIVPSS